MLNGLCTGVSCFKSGAGRPRSSSHLSRRPSLRGSFALSTAVSLTMIIIVEAKAYGGLCFGWVLPASWMRVSAQRPKPASAMATDTATDLSPRDRCLAVTKQAVQQVLWRQSSGPRHRSRASTHVAQCDRLLVLGRAGSSDIRRRMSTQWRTIFSSSPSKRKVVLERHQLRGEDRPQHQWAELIEGL